MGIQVVQVKLQTTAAQLDLLSRTLAACNDTANMVSGVAHTNATYRPRDLRAISYAKAREHRGLGAQAALLVIHKVAAGYATLRANLKADRYGPAGSFRRRKVEETPITFGEHSAQAFDDRCLSWSHSDDDPSESEPAGTVSIWTIDGRLKDVPFLGLAHHIELLRCYRKGETDLVIRRNRRGQLCAFLLACVDIPDAPQLVGPMLHREEEWIGVDLGICNIAVTSDRELSEKLVTDFGEHARRGPCGTGSVKARRDRYRRLRQELARKNTKSSKRRLKARARKEARYAADVNHQIAKTIVVKAERTGRGVAVEKLTGIRERVRQRKPDRATHASWAFAQLGGFIEYRCARAGVPFREVDPADTSRRCHPCGLIDKRNRTSQGEFACLQCGYREHADLNGSDNIALLAANDYRRAESTVLDAAQYLTATQGVRTQAQSFRTE